MAQIRINPEEIDTIISKLTEANENINRIWSKLMSEDIPQIQEEWAGPDSLKYVDKVNEAGNNIKKAIDVQKLLIDTFTQAKADIERVQAENINNMNNI